MINRALLVAAAGLALLAPLASAQSKTSHKDWPKINGDLKMHKQDQDGELRATKVNKHNELLGGHGDDVITAGNVGDVLWGDSQPGGQPESQTDQIFGGPAKDFIYGSHGKNEIHTGGGNDQIHVHFGHGDVYCEGAKPTVFISHKNRPNYKLHGCKRISYKTGRG
jgi:Ca2+-binding RTX toxin-like protein